MFIIVIRIRSIVIYLITRYKLYFFYFINMLFVFKIFYKIFMKALLICED